MNNLAIRYHKSQIKSQQSTQSTQRALRSAISVTTYEKAALSRLRTRMTRIARIITDPCASASSAQSVFYYIPSLFCVHPRLIFVSLSDKTHPCLDLLHNKPQINADERRYNLNNELERTGTNSIGVSSYGVRTSSMLISVGGAV